MRTSSVWSVTVTMFISSTARSARIVMRPSMMMRTEKDMRRTLNGYGGIKCPCCNKWGVHPRKSKPLERRYIRRTIKQIVRDMTP